MTIATPTQLEENYDFPVAEAGLTAEVVAEAPTEAEGKANHGQGHMDILLKSKVTIVIQLFPATPDGEAEGRPGLLGVQLDKNAPSLVSLTGGELTPLPDVVWKLAQAQAAIIAAKGNSANANASTGKSKTGGKQAHSAATTTTTPQASKNEKPKTQATPTPAPAPAPKTKAVPVIERGKPLVQSPRPEPVQAGMDDIYSLFDL